MNNDNRRKHPHGCDLTVQASGLIVFRSRPTRALRLKQGDHIDFCCLQGQLYVYKTDTCEGLCVYGRHSQYHTHSAKVARSVLACVKGMPAHADKADLICPGVRELISLHGVPQEAVVVINRYIAYDKV